MRRTLRPALLATTALLALPAQAQAPDARPQGGTVVAGQASIAQTPARTQVNQSTGRAVIEWNSFDIGANHHVDIRQPAANSWSLQRVTGPDPSAIAGRLTSNGGVAITNRAGIVFSGGAQVDVAGLIASAADTTNASFMAGRMAFDIAPRPGARVENRGTVTVADQGLAALVGPVAANSGTIRARLGRVAIAGAEAVTIDLAGDGLLSFDITRQVTAAPSGATALATNTGTVDAPGGHVLLTARAASNLLETLIEAGGTVTASTITANAPGGGVRIPAGALLDASASAAGGRVTVGAAAASTVGAPRDLAARTTVAAGASIRADATAGGPGGTVIIHSADRTAMSGRISARGTQGGTVEVSSRRAVRIDGTIKVGATGRVLIDPEYLSIVHTPADPSEIAASVVNDTDGLLILQADRGIRVLATVDRTAGPLTLATTNTTASAGDGISIEAPLSVLGDLRLTTAGDVTQAPGARIAASTLYAESRTGSVRLDAPDNAITSLDGGFAAGPFAVTTATRLSVDALVQAGSIALTTSDALLLRAPLAADTAIALVSTGFDGITQAETGAGLTTPRLTVEAPLGPVRLGGAGNHVATLGDSEASGGLTLVTSGALGITGNVNAAGADIRLTATTGDLTQGANTRLIAAGLAAAAPAGAVRLDAEGNDIARVSATARDSIALATAGALLVEAAGLDAPAVTLAATGDIAQDTDALVVAATLRARSAEGAVQLNDPLNRVAALDASGAATTFALATTGTLRLTGLLEAPEVSLTAATALVGDGGAIRTDLLHATATTGSVSLGDAGNRIAALGGSGAAWDFTLDAGTALAVTGDITAGRTLTLRATDIALAADLSAATAALTASAGDIAQSTGAITAATLRAEATGEVRLAAAANAIAAASGRAGPLFRLSTTGDLTTGDLAADAIELRATGAITQPATALGITTPLLALDSGTAVTLAATTNTIDALGPVAAPDGLTLRTTTGLELAAPLTLPGVAFHLGGGLTQRDGAPLAAGTLTLTAGGDVTLAAPGNALPRILQAETTGALTLATGGALALEGPITATDTLRLTAADAITQPTGRIAAPVLIARSNGAGVTLDGPNLVGAIGGGATGTFRLTHAGAAPLRLAGLVAAPETVLTAPAGLQESTGSIRTQVLSIDSDGAVVLEGAGHVVEALSGVRAAGLRLATVGALEVTGAVDLGGALALQADAIALRAPVSSTDALLVAAAGDISQSAALTVTGALQAYASGDVALGLPANAIRALSGGSAGGAFALATGTALRAGGALAGETITLRAAGPLTLDGAAFRAGRAVLVAAPAGIAAAATTSIEPLDAARLPVLILDTRPAGLAAIPPWVAADLPGLAATAQATQLADFGASGSAAAGGLAFDLAAGLSPVFLLIDGAAALGALDAGRLGVLGEGGTAFLLGTLGGIGGEGAATGISVSGAAASYRFNNCPMGVANCGAPPPGGGGNPPGGGGDPPRGGGETPGGGGETPGEGGGGEPPGGGGETPGAGGGTPGGGGTPVGTPATLRLWLAAFGPPPGGTAWIFEPGMPVPWAPWPPRRDEEP